MELKKQVCSVQLAQRLRELGVQQDSLFWHWATDVEEDGLTWWTVAAQEPRRGKRVRELSTPGHYRGKLSAFTVAELGELLPPIISMEQAFELSVTKRPPAWECWYRACGWVRLHQEADTEADARARMLIYLIENKLISTEAQN